jgi:thiamine-monophosphate kinase
LVTGTFGGSILAKQFDFEPRVSEALALMERYELHAGMDVSDGLSLDLARLAAESNCGAVLDLSQIPIADDAKRLALQNVDGKTALNHALSDGEDFELILAVPAKVADQIVREQILDIPVTCIGEFIDQPGLWERMPDGTRHPLTPRGYEHKLHE